MGKAGQKPIIGILGGICSGKSTVAAEFAKLGCKVIDADKIVHNLLDKEDIKDKIVGIFSEDILGSLGKIDKKKLADIVFVDTDKLTSLNRIIHPFVLERAEELIEKYNGQSHVKAIVLDIPLLAEVGWDKKCDKIIFVDCKRELRIKRAKKKGIFDENQLKIRENFQISLDNKVAIADNTIDNNSGFSALAKQIADIFSCIIEKWGLS
ncbi:MAG: dephospho-CoA kinase [Phycisphaerae bacterium]|nr:dephospho-CoA kinase [Phycisphaerae bacterium]NIP54453.1 dephospho-CoA kinase [Phycisphaerae bacterium]NIS53312.1 dephospho-CoA kinase [Phycisphaerae bacterium]NIU10838.1 dephospho-CoA kinase [Phycisphaerae bacterium]NIU58633.1 dephospho-CoA kinase [Phycisphaerae bacterium]